MKSTGRTSSKAVGNASPPRAGGALNEGGAQARRAPQRRKIGILFTSCVVPAASAVAALHLAGCWPLSYSERCEDDARYCTSDGTGGTDQQPDPTCDADPTQDPSTVRDQCAVFARAGAAAGGDGTMARPYASLADAIENANGKRVLACSSGAFKGSVTVGVAAEVIGGFDCNADWAWSAEAQSTIEGDANKAALTLTKGASGATLRSFKIVAADATVAGGSSIGVAVDEIDAELSSVAVIAGNGMDGATGETPEDAQAGASAPASVSNACVGAPAVFGGERGTTVCDDGESSGGVGGLGGIPETDDGNGQKGQDGTPLPAENPDGTGLGGAGQAAAQANCARGEDGGPGAPGSPGEPGTDTELTLAGPIGGDGKRGTSGTRGQGGGGGGGTKAGLFCPAGSNTVEGVGASGGGGGAGGCGGKAGTGGKAGGSSIGIVSLGTNLVLTDVTVTVGKAGIGGMGGDSKPGGLGGMGAVGGTASGKVGSKPGCPGGMGGVGGDGGPGGGGRGGHAVGIAYSVTPSQAPALSVVEGTAGLGGLVGLGSVGDPTASNGAPGVSGACWDFAAKQACPQQ
ncbi:hypothetical protein [Sorangium sp. So ce233]|uniref:hypothetical protein n=1 Tax=Sorangium sp. So ce233 TaxID=3133290 RepID=UPI003F63DAC4